ncbi:MAG TPA: hypothetical protein VFA76_03080 [Terriglobales bacterium]|nr:hypothetical protein [Terriglobales bacterium]
MATAWKLPNRPSRSARESRSLSLEKEVIQAIEETKGAESTSERVNQLLRSALEAERIIQLEKEAEQFYGSIDDREETIAFQCAALKSWDR